MFLFSIKYQNKPKPIQSLKLCGILLAIILLHACFSFVFERVALLTYNFEGSKNYSNEMYTYHESCDQSNKTDDSQRTTLILCLTIPSILILFFSVMLVIFVKKGLICRENNENVISHKNDLYGNLTNEDYFDQRYDTNITDRNQYYDGDGEQYAEYIA